MKKIFNYLKNNCNGIIIISLIFSIAAVYFHALDKFLGILGIAIGIYLTDRQERKRIRREQKNTLLWFAVYLTLAYRHIRETLHVMYMSGDGVKDEMTSFLRLSERIEKNDLKIFDREYDIGCFIRFQYLFNELKYFVNKIKKDASFKRDILILLS